MVGFTLILFAVVLAACGSADARSDNGKDVKKITIVQMPDENNPNAGTKNEAFKEAMEESLGLEVEQFEGADYGVGLEALKNNKLDIMLVSPMSYYQAKKMADIEPLATTAALGAEPYKTVFITRADRDDIQSIEDLRGKTFAFADPASSSGYMYPKAHLISELGLEADMLESPGYFFETAAFSGKHDASLIGVAKGDYDAAAIPLMMISYLADAGLIEAEDIKVIGETSEIPNALYIMRKGLPDELKAKIKNFYLSYDDEEFFETLYDDPNMRFIEVDEANYDEVEEMITILNLEEE